MLLLKRRVRALGTSKGAEPGLIPVPEDSSCAARGGEA
jgi:hypothetical protein